MKSTLLITVFIITSSIYSQTTIICKYQISPIRENYVITKEDDGISQNTKKMLLNAFDIAKDFDYLLKFNKIESGSQIDESMINEGVKSNYLYAIAKVLIGKGYYYQNKKEKIMLHQNEIMGELFVIKDSLINDWEISNVSKKIGNFLCYKATKKCSTCSKIEEVWFAPEIPFPYGPLGYGGLPGLIIEVKNKGSILSLREIKYQNQELKISKPIKGKLITIDEYNEITKRVRANSKKMSN
jgi:GLPGLI family protein